MIDREHALPVARQASLLGVSGGSVYYLPRPLPAADLAVMRRMDELHLEFPFAGSRMLRDLLKEEGIKIGRVAQMIAPYPTLSEVNKRAAGSYYTPTLFGERTRKAVRFLSRFG